jgi:hypothetical protein
MVRYAAVDAGAAVLSGGIKELGGGLFSLARLGLIQIESVPMARHTARNVASLVFDRDRLRSGVGGGTNR